MEELTGNEVYHRPVNEIGFNDGAHAADDDRTGQAHGTDGLDADVHAKDDDASLDVPFRLGGVRKKTGNLRKEVANNKSG